MRAPNPQVVGRVLLGLVIFDLLLIVWVTAWPELWFFAFHGAWERPELAQLFLWRCGANWAAFLLFQAIAWRRWRAEPAWLLVVAGVRWSDIFTDPSYSLLADSTTWFTWLALPAMGLINFALGLYLWRAGRALRAEAVAPAADPV